MIPMAKLIGATIAVAALSAFSLYVGYSWGKSALPEAALAQQIDFSKTLNCNPGDTQLC